MQLTNYGYRTDYFCPTFAFMATFLLPILHVRIRTPIRIQNQTRSHSLWNLRHHRRRLLLLHRLLCRLHFHIHLRYRIPSRILIHFLLRILRLLLLLFPRRLRLHRLFQILSRFQLRIQIRTLLFLPHLHHRFLHRHPRLCRTLRRLLPHRILPLRPNQNRNPNQETVHLLHRRRFRHPLPSPLLHRTLSLAFGRRKRGPRGTKPTM
ncbi:hypothetical protein IC575_006598 [Cucumis melo]